MYCNIIIIDIIIDILIICQYTNRAFVKYIVSYSLYLIILHALLIVNKTIYVMARCVKPYEHDSRACV